MSFHVFFAFSTGLAATLRVPKGTTSSLIEHVATVERTLGIKRTKHGKGKDAAIAWDHWDEPFKRGFPDIDDKLLCETAEAHNRWVRWQYDRFAEWSEKPVRGGEKMTPKAARQFWPGLEILKVDPDRWTRDYYVARMEELYEAMRGRAHGAAGMTLDAKPLTPRQCSAVINLFDQYLDAHDMRLDVPKGHDYLASSYDGGYDWCTKCGAVTPEDGDSCNKRKCPLREETAHLRDEP